MQQLLTAARSQSSRLVAARPPQGFLYGRIQRLYLKGRTELRNDYADNLQKSEQSSKKCSQTFAVLDNFPKFPRGKKTLASHSDRTQRLSDDQADKIGCLLTTAYVICAGEDIVQRERWFGHDYPQTNGVRERTFQADRKVLRSLSKSISLRNSQLEKAQSSQDWHAYTAKLLNRWAYAGHLNAKICWPNQLWNM